MSLLNRIKAEFLREEKFVVSFDEEEEEDNLQI
jgi:hypothetical protein